MPARCVCRLVEEYPEHVVAWFAVGCYYQSIGRYDSARQYFGKATAMDPSFAPAWLGFGHSFAAQDESDQVRPACTALHCSQSAGEDLTPRMRQSQHPMLPPRAQSGRQGIAATSSRSIRAYDAAYPGEAGRIAG